MPWFKVDDKLHSHPKRYRAGLAAMGLWTIAGSWASDQLTDGFIPADILKALGGTKAHAKSLVDAGLWDEEPGGYRFHDWAEQNPTRADVHADRQRERDRKAEWRAKKATLRAVRNTT